MTLNDQLANALSIILNTELTGKKECLIRPSSRLLLEVFKVMKEHGYLREFRKSDDSKGSSVHLQMTGAINKCGVIKPRYNVKIGGIEKFEKRYLPAKDVGMLVISTPFGIMTHYDAKQKNTGGKLIAYCY